VTATVTLFTSQATSERISFETPLHQHHQLRPTEVTKEKTPPTKENDGSKTAEIERQDRTGATKQQRPISVIEVGILNGIFPEWRNCNNSDHLDCPACEEHQSDKAPFYDPVMLGFILFGVFKH
jgi:hypothetical protein